MMKYEKSGERDMNVVELFVLDYLSRLLKNYMKLDYSLYGVDLFVKYFSASPLNFTVKRT